MTGYRRLGLLGALVGLAACASAPGEPQPTATGEYLAGRLAARVNAVDDAAKAFALAVEKAPNEAAAQRGAFFYELASGDVDGAFPYAERLAAKTEADERMRGLAGLLLAAREIKAGRYVEARARLQTPMNLPVINAVAFLMDVWVEDGLKGSKAAIAKLDKPKESVFAGFSPLHRGFLADKIGLSADARAGLEGSVVGLGGPVGRAAFGAFLERSGDVKAARAFYQMLASAPGAGRRAAEQAEIRLAEAKPSLAYVAVQPAQGSAIALYSFAAAFTQQITDEQARAEQAGMRLGDPAFDVPLAVAQMALYLDPSLDDARRLVADIYNLYGDHADAARLLEPIPPTSPHFEGARTEMASALVADKREKEALALLAAAMKADPASRELRWTAANIHEEAGRHKDSVAALTALIDRLPAKPPRDAWRYFVSRAESLLALDRWPDAEADLKRAVQIAPDEPTALNYLGYSWAERGLNLDDAFALIEKAVAAEPYSGAFVDSLGWAHFQRGDYLEAVKHLEKAAALEPADPTVIEHLGDVYWRLGRQIEARYQWRMALQLNPKPAQKTAIETKLKDGMPPAGAAPSGPAKDKR